MEDQPAQQTKQSIVVVEDEILVRMTIPEYLRDCGFRVIEAATGEEAMLLLQQADLAIDVVLSDVDLGAGMDGRLCLSAMGANESATRAGGIGRDSGSGCERGGVILRRGSPSRKAIRSTDRAGSDQASPGRAQMMLRLNTQAPAS
jgi:PleD family two-component response regulator